MRYLNMWSGSWPATSTDSPEHPSAQNTSQPEPIPSCSFDSVVDLKALVGSVILRADSVVDLKANWSDPEHEFPPFIGSAADLKAARSDPEH